VTDLAVAAEEQCRQAIDVVLETLLARLPAGGAGSAHVAARTTRSPSRSSTS
jgi:hypothetical protein